MLRMELPGKRKRGRSKQRFMDAVKEDMAEVELTEEDTDDRNIWRWKICCGDPWWEKPTEEEASQVIIYVLSAFFKACSNQTEPYFISTVTDSGNE